MHLGTPQPTTEVTISRPKEWRGEKQMSAVTGGTSSPIKKTEGSADISSSKEEFNASRTVI